jgi:hypothetical protein
MLQAGRFMGVLNGIDLEVGREGLLLALRCRKTQECTFKLTGFGAWCPSTSDAMRHSSVAMHRHVSPGCCLQVWDPRVDKLLASTYAAENSVEGKLVGGASLAEAQSIIYNTGDLCLTSHNNCFSGCTSQSAMQMTADLHPQG